MNRALFLDRDGTLIVDTGYPNDPDKVIRVDACVPVLQWAKAQGFYLVVVSNQSGVARGLITPAQAAAVDAQFQKLFAAEGIVFDAVHYCMHAPDDACACRKPNPGMLRESIVALALDPAQCWMIGDKPSDCEAGRNAGVPALLLEHESGAFGWPEVLVHIARVPV